VVGVDGCPGGWVAAALRDGRVRWALLGDPGPLFRCRADAVAIDIPIGLPPTGPRRCDVLARGRLGARAASVFPAPVRAVLAAADYRAACELSRRVSGRALSMQTWNLLPRIRAVDRLAGPADEPWLIECHPELAFARRAGGPLPAKRGTEGRAARAAVLGTQLAGAAAALAGAPRPARFDDAADALVCALVARDWVAGRAEVLPATAERDRRGLAMRIVC
jgi:predicted RNase H-like nuclease